MVSVAWSGEEEVWAVVVSSASVASGGCVIFRLFLFSIVRGRDLAQVPNIRLPAPEKRLCGRFLSLALLNVVHEPRERGTGCRPCQRLSDR